MKTLVVLVVAICVGVAFGSDDDIRCEGKPENSFVSDPSRCENYFLCQNNRAIPGTCKSGWFDQNRQACAPRGDFCTQPPCLDVQFKFVPNPTTCGGWHYCRDRVLSHSGTCPDGLSLQGQVCTDPPCSEIPAVRFEEKLTPEVVV